MQEPTAEHERLAVFAGSWIGREISHPTAWDPKGGEAIALVRARMGLGGFS
jgi:hypothetical protein